MKSFFNLFVRSAKELKSLRCLSVTAMLIALDIVLKLTVSIDVTESMKISFAFVALSAIGMLYGPTVGFIAGFITDLLGFIIKPTGAFDIRFTLIEATGALIYGLFLYNSVSGKWFVPRIVAAKTSVVIVCNLWLTTWAVSSMMGKGFFAMLPARAVKNMIQLPVDIIIMSLFLPLVLKAYTAVFKNARKVDEKTIFSDSGVAAAMIYLICIMLIVMCCFGLSSQDLINTNKALKSTSSEQQKKIDELQSQIDRLYESLNLENPVLNQTELESVQ